MWSLVKKVAKRITIHDIPDDISPSAFIQLTVEDQLLLEQIKSHDSELGNVLESRDESQVRMLLMKRHMNRHAMIYKKRKELEAIEADPMNEENQKKIEEMLRQENIQQNMDLAIENLPEAFGSVSMLYVDIHVNGYPIKAFVDSGAQSTIMSAACADRCGLMRILDTRFAGQAVGIGTAKILGRVHLTQMKFGSSFFPISLTVIDSNGVDFLFGLDMLRRYKCIIDLNRNVLRIESGESVFEELPFLGESETKALGLEGGSPRHKVADIPESTSMMEASNQSADLEPKIEQLLSLGFSNSEARSALLQTNGNVDLAASYLMERSMNMDVPK
jgi:DNA damage-inducible protein 1